MRIVRLLAFVLVALLVSAGGTAADKTTFTAHLSGSGEVPANDTLAQGQAIFHLNDDGTISYKLIVANIDNVFVAHIHLAPEGVNGPVVVFLFGPTALGGGRADGVLVADGTITAASLTGPLAGHPLSDLIAAIEAGNTYVNAHTNDGVPPPNTGPGDFPGGEIRGQIH
jgi:CHRD domain